MNNYPTLKARITYTIDVYEDDFIEVRENGFYEKWNFKRGDKESAIKMLQVIGDIFGIKIKADEWTTRNC